MTAFWCSSEQSNLQCSALNSIRGNTLCSKSWKQSTSLHSTCRVEHISAISETLPPLFSDLLCNVHSAKHIVFARCALQSIPWQLATFAGDVSYYRLLRDSSAQCHKGPHKQRDREQAQRELESFSAKKKWNRTVCKTEQKQRTVPKCGTMEERERNYGMERNPRCHGMMLHQNCKSDWEK